jgi:Glycosyl hydrolase family 9/Cellulase N-terminal ig-like domain
MVMRGVFVAVMAALVACGAHATGTRAGQRQPAAGTATVQGFVRVDQLGYARSERKIAYLLAPQEAPAIAFRVVDDHGVVVFHGHAGASRGAWNAGFRSTQPLRFSGLRTAGTYHIEVRGAVRADSPDFQIGTRAALFDPRVADTVAFFQVQRDGSDVIAGPLDRQPAHLNDASASVYAWPTYKNKGSDVIVGSDLTPLDASVDLEGGWFDAGDFIKFTHTTAYAVTLMLESQRTLRANAPATLLPEARFGLDWLQEAWDSADGVLYLQVGIGSGNQAGTFNGDHDVWRLPEVDDTLIGSANRYLRNRPAFRANEPGTRVPPNLAGRVAAAFALAAQVDAASNPTLAGQELDTGAAIYAAAKKHGVKPGDVVTALPHAFYPESSWRDDLELGGAELALAGQALGDPRAATWLQQAAHWARGYLAKEAGSDTLNLYDTSALAHADLIRAMRRAGWPTGLAVSRQELVADMRAQLEMGRARAAADPFRAGAIYSDFDAAPHTFGLVATAELFRKVTGSRRYARFATAQRDWALGANAWGASLMVGVGTSFPLCMQHVVANLSGSLDGSPPIVQGAVVNGPNDRSLFQGGLGGFFDEAPACPADGVDQYRAFTGHGSRYVDDVRSWQTVEPALDFDAAAMFAFALVR